MFRLLQLIRKKYGEGISFRQQEAAIFNVRATASFKEKHTEIWIAFDYVFVEPKAQKVQRHMK